jgi:uncharacterized protein with PIN domain
MVNTGWCDIDRDMSTAGTQSPTVCPTCNGSLAYPVDWQQLADVLWLTWLRCPNCESIIPRVLDDDAVYSLDEALDRGTYALMQELKRIARGGSTEWLVPGRPSS